MRLRAKEPDVVARDEMVEGRVKTNGAIPASPDGEAVREHHLEVLARALEEAHNRRTADIVGWHVAHDASCRDRRVAAWALEG